MTIAAWPDLRAGLTALFSKLAGTSLDEPAAVTEAGESWAMPGPSRASLKWRIREVQSLGRTELRSHYDGLAVIAGDTYVPPTGPALGGIIYTAGDNWLLTAELKVEGGDQEASAAAMARRLSTRLGLPSAMAAYEALGLGLSTRPAMRDVSGPDLTGRAVQAYVLDVVFTGATEETDDPVTTIEIANWCICGCDCGGD